jgi:hypothetical protein
MYIRKPSFAGSFYPGSRDELILEIDRHLNAVPPSPPKNAKGYISPHAGYIYSGPVAAYTYAALKSDMPEMLIVLAPSHRASFEGASVIPEGYYETPVARTAIDSEISMRLLDSDLFNFYEQVHRAEHSLEVQIPFAQRVLGDFTLVPVIIGTTDLSICAELAAVIERALEGCGKKFSIVISTDLSHFHGYDEAVRIDSGFIKALESFNTRDVYEAAAVKGAEACGLGPILTGMTLCGKLGASEIEILKYANSGDSSGDKSRVVGYLSAAVK